MTDQSTPTSPEIEGSPDQQTALIVVSGLSGSGISTALEALEDQGFFCVDNLPPPLIGKLVELAAVKEKSAPLAIGLDARNIHDAGSAQSALEALEELNERGYTHRLIFLEASEEVLIKRFSTSRRAHPLTRSGLSLIEGMSRERVLIRPLRELAHHYVDTSELNVHQCKRLVKQLSSLQRGTSSLSLQIVSFGFRHGPPKEADIIWDVRFLPNPHFVPELRPLSGLDQPVQDVVLGHPMTNSLLEKLVPLLLECLPAYEREGKSYLTVGIGCTGGHHRSVAVAEEIKSRLVQAGWLPYLRHRDLDKAY